MPEPPLELLGVAGALSASAAEFRLSLHDGLVGEGGSAGAVDRALEARPRALVLGTPGPFDGALAPLDRTAARELVHAGLRARDSAPAGGAPTRIALAPEDTALAEHLLREGAVDVVVRGEPEEALPAALLAALDAPRLAEAWRGVRGLTWRGSDGGPVHEAPARRPLAPATPAWELLDLTPYRAPAARRGPLGLLPRRTSSSATAAIRTGQGCSEWCPTCHGSFGAPGPERSVREVVAEIRDLVTRRGVRELRILDHAFDGKPARAAEIARAIQRIREAPAFRGLVVRFPRGFRGDGLTPELAGALVALGVRRFDVHVGTASDRLQRLLRRNIRLERARLGLEAVARAGGVPRLHLLLGLPTETVGEAAHTIRWAASSRALELVVENGAGASFGPHFRRDGVDEIDDFTSQRRRAAAAFFTDRRRGPARIWRAGLARAFAEHRPAASAVPTSTSASA